MTIATYFVSLKLSAVKRWMEKVVYMVYFM